MAPFLRISRNPHKQLMWMWVCKLLAESRSYQRGLDLACGELKTFKYFQTKEYTGVDADESRVDYARGKFNVPVITSRIEDLPEALTGDFVVCLQTIGFNKYFELPHAVDVVRRCVDATAPAGMLLFNAANLSLQQYDAIEAMLKSGFDSLEIRPYAITSVSVSKPVSLAMAAVWRMFPSLMSRGDGPAWLFICRNRKR